MSSHSTDSSPLPITAIPTTTGTRGPSTSTTLPARKRPALLLLARNLLLLLLDRFFDLALASFLLERLESGFQQEVLLVGCKAKPYQRCVNTKKPATYLASYAILPSPRPVSPSPPS